MNNTPTNNSVSTTRLIQTICVCPNTTIVLKQNSRLVPGLLQGQISLGLCYKVSRLPPRRLLSGRQAYCIRRAQFTTSSPRTTASIETINSLYIQVHTSIEHSVEQQPFLSAMKVDLNTFCSYLYSLGYIHGGRQFGSPWSIIKCGRVLSTYASVWERNVVYCDCHNS